MIISAKQMDDIMKQKAQMMSEIKSLFDQKIGTFQENYLSLAKKFDDTNSESENLTQKVENIESEIEEITKVNREAKDIERKLKVKLSKL